jgi:hypothetical protein
MRVFEAGSESVGNCKRVFFEVCRMDFPLIRLCWGGGMLMNSGISACLKVSSIIKILYQNVVIDMVLDVSSSY